MAYLKVVDGPNTGQIWELREPRTVLGRHPDCHVPIDMPDVSRHHAQLSTTAEGWILDDLNSLNGTFLNNAPISRQQRVGDGDRIRIRSSVFKFYQGPFLESPAVDWENARRHASVRDARNGLANYLEAGESAPASDGSSGSLPPSFAMQLRALLQISQNLRKTLALDEVLPQILKSLFIVFPAADRGLIALRDDQGGIVPQWVRLREGIEDNGVLISRCVADRVMESQQAILSADTGNDEHLGNSGSLQSLPARALLCAPLIDNDGDSFGILQIDAILGRGSFGEGDLEVFLSVAAQASIAIENARLYERTVRQRAITQELELAEQIQRGRLSRTPPQLPRFEFFDYYQPAHCIGGDFYDYIPLPNGRIAIVVANVPGHGLASAMWVAKLGAEVRLQLFTAPGPAEAVRQLNDALVCDASMDHFITLLLAVLCPDTGEIAMVNAGHAPPILRRADGRADEVFPEQSQLPLGVAEGTEYFASKICLPPRGVLAIYSDGLCAAMNAEMQAYGVDRILAQLQVGGDSVQQLGQRMIDDVHRFIDVAPPTDDICLVCFGWK